jgi:hypothetical protein
MGVMMTTYESEINLFRCLTHLAPKTLGISKIRLGDANDGGYVVVNDDLSNLGGVLTFGVGPTFAFEQEMSERFKLPRVLLCDPTIDRPSGLADSLQFEKIGIAGKNEGAFLTLEQAVKTFNIEFSRRWLLKIDVEGSEWAALENVEKSTLFSFDQIILEFHFWSRDWERYLNCLQVLREGFVPVHIHGNNHSPLLQAGGLELPEVTEITYFSKRRLQALGLDETTLRNEEHYPTPFDRPNDPDQPEIYFTAWPFRCDFIIDKGYSLDSSI